MRCSTTRDHEEEKQAIDHCEQHKQVKAFGGSPSKSPLYFTRVSATFCRAGVTSIISTNFPAHGSQTDRRHPMEAVTSPILSAAKLQMSKFPDRLSVTTRNADNHSDNGSRRINATTNQLQDTRVPHRRSVETLWTTRSTRPAVRSIR